MTDPRPFRVPFVCTHDSARRPMAEAILRREGGESFVVESAGSEPWSVVHPIAPLFIEGLGGAPVGTGRLTAFRRAQRTLTRRIERLLAAAAALVSFVPRLLLRASVNPKVTSERARPRLADA